ncbi:DUF1538 domain-containing protein [Thiorhodococcus mannitoliphagus]|uniref:DUF1538 domain-containing protein n=1 Tax=Thiorhodococcus mannitoliphagus TaxID=329406 RepID=A0A6P1DZK4_9GAMM|nr:DUF1538 domain-containing protein [Thiorhodococcus mannitoliphagus]NEX22483.1 DUF1538 domain-containing protein [Thiorhodococcus mannitoliphagus]
MTVTNAPVRYADYLRAIGAGRREMSYSAILLPAGRDARGRPVPAPATGPIRLHPDEILALLRPYVSVRFLDQVKAVVPLALYLALFQILILRQLLTDSWLITGGLFAVILGLMCFMEGLKLGLMPFGELIGHSLPRKSPLPLVLLITLLLGIGVTFAEPAIGALQAAGQNLSPERAPYLWALLNPWSGALVLVIGSSVGLAAVLGTLRFLYGWSLKPLIYASLVPVLGLTLYGASDPELAKVLGLAWDAGAVTTGPVTVPLVLSLGIGIAAAAGRGDSGLSGFGIVTLASLFPIIGVLLLAFYVAGTVTPAEIIAAAASLGEDTAVLAWYQRSPWVEVILGLRAILPLVLFLFIILKLVLKEDMPRPSEMWLGIALTVIGMCLFNLGLTYGLSALGASAGSLVPAAFMEVPAATGSPLYLYGVGLTLALVFAWVLGFGATIAEPALNALGVTAEQLTNGFFKKRTLILAVSFGVACGIALGLTKLIFDLPLVWIIVPPYLLAAALTLVSSEEFVNVAWDSAGVTTGPITVPLVLAMGLGFGNATQAVEGFGILCLASIGPIISVLLTGLWARMQAGLQQRAADGEPVAHHAQEVQSLL